MDVAASVGGNPTAGTGGGPSAGGSYATGGTFATGGSSIGGTGGVVCADSSYPSLCEHGFEIFQHIHAGCTVYECGPISDCNVDGDCPSGQVCFAGAECDDACALPSCCSGNRCGPPSCPALNDVTCLAVGCPVGDVCNATCNSARCTCDGAIWNCTYDGGATPSCASACVLP